VELLINFFPLFRKSERLIGNFSPKGEFGFGVKNYIFTHNLVIVSFWNKVYPIVETNSIALFSENPSRFS